MKILTFNVGSSSIRAGVLNFIGADQFEIEHEVRDTHLQIDALLDECTAFAPFSCVAHRVVHGGAFSLSPAKLVDDEVRAEIEGARDLAPDHNPTTLNIIERCKERFGASTAQIAVFDSAFHRTMPACAFTYPIPSAIAQRYGIRRYGFHGLSHEYGARRVQRMDPRRPLRHVSVHVGNGVSATAILDGASTDTTMGFTPLEGAMMGTRSGSLDPGIIFELERKGFTHSQLRLILDGESGLFGLSGFASDYRQVSEEAHKGDEACVLALEVFIHRLTGEIARMIVSAGGIDVLSFTGGIGEHSIDLRAAICARLAFLDIELDAAKNRSVLLGHDHEITSVKSGVRVFLIASNETEMIARHAFELTTAVLSA